MSKWIDQAKAAAESIDGRAAATDDDVQKHLPALYDLLTVTVTTEGKPRRTGMVMVMCEGGRWKIGYVGRDINRSLWAEGESLRKAVEELELQLQVGSNRWQARGRR